MGLVFSKSKIPELVPFISSRGFLASAAAFSVSIRGAMVRQLVGSALGRKPETESMGTCKLKWEYSHMQNTIKFCQSFLLYHVGKQTANKNSGLGNSVTIIIITNSNNMPNIGHRHNL